VTYLNAASLLAGSRGNLTGKNTQKARRAAGLKKKNRSIHKPRKRKTGVPPPDATDYPKRNRHHTVEKKASGELSNDREWRSLSIE